MQIFEEKYNCINGNVKKKFCGGIIKTVKSETHKDYFLFGLHIATKEINGYKEVYYLRTPNLFKIHNIKRGLKRLYKEVPSEYDSIYYISVPTGEGYILANLLPEIIKLNGSKKPFILLGREYLNSIFDIFCPSIENKEIYKLPYDLDFRKLCEHHYSYKNKDFYIFFPTKHYFLQDKKIINDKNNNTHFYNYICESLKLNVNTNSFYIKNLNISEEVFNKKIQHLNLNLDKFVIFAPEANTCKLYPKEFYVELAKILEKHGFDIFWNLCKTEYLDTNIKTAELSIEELFFLAMKSKGVIGLRSGLFDILSSLNNISKFVLYTEFPQKDKKTGQYYTSEKAMAGFSLKKLPNIDISKIYEYDTNLLKQRKLIELITNTLIGV